MKNLLPHSLLALLPAVVIYSCKKDDENKNTGGGGDGNNTNSCAGGQTAVTDIDGYVYNVVNIGNQCWMQENLKTTR
jgi:hypothetical protein